MTAVNSGTGNSWSSPYRSEGIGSGGGRSRNVVFESSTSTSSPHVVTGSSGGPSTLYERSSWSSNRSADSPGRDDLMNRQIEQARQQRTGFYRRLAETSRRGLTPSNPVVTSSVLTGRSTDSGGGGGYSRRSDLVSSMNRRRAGRLEHQGLDADGAVTIDEPSVVHESSSSNRGLNDPLVFTDTTNTESPKPQTRYLGLTLFCL